MRPRAFRRHMPVGLVATAIVGIMAKLAVVAFPSLEDRDRQWIESFRTQHDPQASRIDVHFTLVFPVDTSEVDLASEIAVAAQSTPPIAFVARRAEVVSEAFGHGSHVFLVADEGGAHISALHDRLYAGVLRVHLRPDIPFVPHMTVAATSDSTSAVRLADELNSRARPVRGVVKALELVDVGAARVRSIATYTLAGTT
jgi:2'-5' RNA ligase